MRQYNFNDNKPKKSSPSFFLFFIILILSIASYSFFDKDLQDKIMDNTINLIGTNESSENIDKDKEIKSPEVKEENKEDLKPLSISKKKQRFLDLMVEPINEVYLEFDILYKEIKTNPSDKRITALKKQYKVKTYEELLHALKPHPRSLALAQAAMESAWATSRFFTEAKNIFGVWSVNKNEPRVPALVKRGDKTVYVRKYQSIKESIRSYYITLSRSSAFKEFRALNYEKEFANPYELTTKLDKYSEKGAEYGKELNDMISYNKFVRFDEVTYAKPIIKPTQKEIDSTLKVVETVEGNESSVSDILNQVKK